MGSKNITYFFAFLFSLVTYSAAYSSELETSTLSPSMPCNKIEESEGCDRCFDGGNLYAGQMYRLYNSTKNHGSEHILYRDDLGTVSFKNLQPGLTDWNIHEVVFEDPKDFLWSIGGSGRYYYILSEKAEDIRLIQTASGKGLMMTRVSNLANLNNYALRVKYTTNFYKRDGGALIKEKTESCVYYKPSWCGDGFIDNENNEECDSGKDNLSDTGRCSKICKNIGQD